MVSQAIQERYLRDPLPIRLGGLAADLARIASFAANPLNHEAVGSLLEEGKYFAEWAAQDAPLDVQETLAQIQMLLAWWQRGWTQGKADLQMSAEAERWSHQLLAMAGLI